MVLLNQTGSFSPFPLFQPSIARMELNLCSVGTIFQVEYPKNPNNSKARTWQCLANTEINMPRGAMCGRLHTEHTLWEYT